MKFHDLSATTTVAHKVFDTWSAAETQPKSEGIPTQHLSDSVPDLRGRVLHVTIHQLQQFVPTELVCEVFSAYGEVAEMFQPPDMHSHIQAPSLFIEYEHSAMADKALHDLHGICLYPNDCQLDIRHANLKELQNFYGYCPPKFSQEQRELLQQIQRDLQGLKKIATCGMTKVYTGTDHTPTPPSQHKMSVDGYSGSTCVPEGVEGKHDELEQKQPEQNLMQAPTQLQFELENYLIPASINLDEESATGEPKIGNLDTVIHQWPREQKFPSACGAKEGGIHVAATGLQPRDDLACSLSTSLVPLSIVVPIELQYELSYSATVPVPQVLDDSPVTTSANNSALCAHIKNTPLMLPWDPGTQCCAQWESNGQIPVNNVLDDIPVSTAISHSSSSAGDSDGKTGDKSLTTRKLKHDVIVAIGDLIEEIDTCYDQISEQAVEHIHQDEVFLPLKLLVPLSKSREPGMCSGLGCAPTHSVYLFPWDPGEKPIVLRDSILTRNIAGDACVKQLRYANTQKYFYWPIQVLCSSQNVIGKCSCKGIYEELLCYQFDSAAYSQVPIENFLVGSFCDVPSNIHPLYPEVSYLSLSSSFVPYHIAPATVRLILPYGFDPHPWKNDWFSLFDILRENSSSCEFRPYILRSQTAVLLLIAFGNTTLEGLMEKWDPGIARFFHMCIQHCLVSCHLISIAVTKVRPYVKLLHHGFQFSTTDHILVEGNEFKILLDMKIANSCDASLSLEKLKAVGKSIVLSLLSVFYISPVRTSAYQEQQHVFEANFAQFVNSKCDTWDPGITAYRTLQPDSDTLQDFYIHWSHATNNMLDSTSRNIHNYYIGKSLVGHRSCGSSRSGLHDAAHLGTSVFLDGGNCQDPTLLNS